MNNFPYTTDWIINRGDIYWYNFDNEYSEQTGKRPCVVVSNDIANRHSPVVTVVPMTSRDKKPLPTHVSFVLHDIKSTVLCEQIFSVSKQRLGKYIGKCSYDEMQQINNCLRIQLGL